MDDSTKAAPWLISATAIALAVLGLAAFAWFADATAGAANTSAGGSATSGELQPVQSQEDQDGAPADRGRDGHPCPEEAGAGRGSGAGESSGSSGEQDAPATASPATPL